MTTADPITPESLGSAAAWQDPFPIYAALRPRSPVARAGRGDAPAERKLFAALAFGYRWLPLRLEPAWATPNGAGDGARPVHGRMGVGRLSGSAGHPGPHTWRNASCRKPPKVNARPAPEGPTRGQRAWSGGRC